MYHIIAHRQFRKALNLFPLIGGLLPLPFLLPGAEHIPLGNHHELNLGILKTTVKIAVSDQNLPRLHLPFLIVRTERAQLILPQIPGQTAGSRPGTGQQNHPVLFPLPSLQILNQNLKTVLIGVHIFDLNVIPVLRRHPGYLLLQPRQHGPVLHLHSGQRLLRREQQGRLSRKQISLLQPVHHALPEFRLHSLPLLPKSGRLIQEKSSLIRRKILQKRHRIRIKIRQKAVPPADMPALFQPLRQFPDNPLNPGGLLRLQLLSERFLILLRFFANFIYPGPYLLLAQHHLRSRIDKRLLQLLHRALALNIKGADGIHLIVPQLNSKRQFLRQWENVDDTATDGKLSHPVHLGHSLIPQSRQPFLPGFHIDGLPGLHLHHLGFQITKGYQMVHQPVNRRHHHAAFVFI